jgi:hypothetical protein
MLLGWALRTFGPQLKYSRPPLDNDVDFQVEQRFWARFIQGLGGVIAIAGTTMVLMTFVVVLVNPDDDTGGQIALAIWAFVLVALVLWCCLYVKHYGLTGVWSRSGGYGFRGSSAPRRRSGESTEVSSVSPKKRLNRDVDVVPATALQVETDSVNPDLTSAEQPEDSPDGDTGTAPDTALPEPPDTTVYDFGDVGDTTVPSDAGGRSQALRRLRERQARARQSST